MLDLIWNYEDTLKLSNDEVFERLSQTFPNYNLYDMSLGWRESSEYILKAKGACGDVIVGWE